MKKKVLILMALYATLANCTKEDDNNLSGNNSLPQPTMMNVFCQANPEECFQEYKYEYDSNNLISEMIFTYGVLYSQKIFEYNSNDQLKKEIYDIISHKWETEYLYNEANQLIKKIYTLIVYNDAQQEIDRRTQEATFEYKNNLLVKEVQYWGSWNIYEYNTAGRMITNTVYTTAGERYHITHYKYSGYLKIEEWSEVHETGKIMYLHKFKYDKKNRLVEVLNEDNKIIEKNIYSGDYLKEKRVFYFGIDPCSSACCGNYIYKYEY